MSEAILRLPQVIQVTGLSRSAIYDQISKSEFPTQIKLSARAAGWLQSEIYSWLEQKVRESRSAA